MEMLGSADRIVVMKEQTTIVSDGKNSDAVAARIKTIRADAEASESQVLLCAPVCLWWYLSVFLESVPFVLW